jgi:hypothetical protein
MKIIFKMYFQSFIQIRWEIILLKRPQTYTHTHTHKLLTNQGKHPKDFGSLIIPTQYMLMCVWSVHVHVSVCMWLIVCGTVWVCYLQVLFRLLLGFSVNFLFQNHACQLQLSVHQSSFVSLSVLQLKKQNKHNTLLVYPTMACNVFLTKLTM